MMLNVGKRRKLGSLARNVAYYFSTRSNTAAADHAFPPAFVFDIDGVLVRGRHVLPEAKHAMEYLYQPDGQNPRVPLAFLTNGGGMTEEKKAKQLSGWLDVKITGDQVVLSHTPFKSFAAEYANKPIVAVGRGRVVDVAHHYGFKQVVTTRHLAEAMPFALPFWEERHHSTRQTPPPQVHFGTEDNPIAAVFIFNDPSDWYMDLQLLCDVITGGGVLGRRHADVPSDAPPVKVYFSNPDLLWANEHSVSRFGQGAFAACLETLHHQLTGKPLQAKRVFGKPNKEPYTLIEEVLEKQARKMGLDLPSTRDLDADGKPLPPFSSIFAVGDNPAADVRGANAAGHPWVSVLVRTGVFQGPGTNCYIDPASIVVDNVFHAVEAGFHRHRSAKWHSMR